ncbi:hypothetical protein XENOCAPTIV_024935, partial [Xenoophorus captivus]
AAGTSQDVVSLRPPRFIHEDGVIRPYKEQEGIGSQMLLVRVHCTLESLLSYLSVKFLNSDTLSDTPFFT